MTAKPNGIVIGARLHARSAAGADVEDGAGRILRTQPQRMGSGSPAEVTMMQAAENWLGNNPTALRWIDLARDRGVALQR